MEILGDYYFFVVLVAGLVGVFWKNRKDIVKATETKVDDKVVDIIEGLCSSLDIDADTAASKAKGKLKEELKKFELERKKKK
ncbi:MAG: hypothetical protein KGY69_13185 [Bacteroidales bacterium]|nr:hypothetical protein [Bacteroidales bacterium]